VRLDESHHDVDPAPAEIVRLLKHTVCLADARRGADVDLELAALAALEQLDKFRSRGVCRLSTGAVACPDP
jgi:hypothetical protein